MRISSKPILVLLSMIVLTSCAVSTSDQPDRPPVVKVDKPFATAGSIEMHLDGGDYTIRAAPDERVRVSFAGNTGNATADLTATGTHANLSIKDTPHSNFRATIEVPATVDLTVRLTGGNLDIGALTGSKDIDSKAGNVTVSIPNSNDYGSVNASVTAGNLSGGPFGNSGSGIGSHLQWSGPGKYTLRANLGAGNLELKR